MVGGEIGSIAYYDEWRHRVDVLPVVPGGAGVCDHGSTDEGTAVARCARQTIVLKPRTNLTAVPPSRAGCRIDRGTLAVVTLGACDALGD